MEVCGGAAAAGVAAAGGPGAGAGAGGAGAGAGAAGAGGAGGSDANFYHAHNCQINNLWCCTCAYAQVRRSEKNLLERLFNVIHHLSPTQVRACRGNWYELADARACVCMCACVLACACTCIV